MGNVINLLGDERNGKENDLAQDLKIQQQILDEINLALLNGENSVTIERYTELLN